MMQPPSQIGLYLQILEAHIEALFSSRLDWLCATVLPY
jgi:hypothetical protein